MVKTKILSLMRDSDGYVSGQELCVKLGVSRTAVWKAVNQLKEEGYEIEAVQNKGYKILHCPDINTESEIGSRLKTEWAGRSLICLDETSSTNVEAKRLAEEGVPHGTLVTADMQKQGRGRRGRSWQSEPGCGIYMSLLLRPSFSPDKAAMLTLVMALAVEEAITHLTGGQCGIKWPNDLVVNGKKVCGILTEMSAEMDYIHNVVIGVGINVNLPESKIPKELKATVTSLMIEKGQSFSRAALIERVMYYFEKYYGLFIKTEDLSEMTERYNSRLVNLGRQVLVLDPLGEYGGTAQGINSLGELLVKKEDGSIVNVYSGEVSIRGLSGYA